MFASALQADPGKTIPRAIDFIFKLLKIQARERPSGNRHHCDARTSLHHLQVRKQEFNSGNRMHPRSSYVRQDRIAETPAVV
jgi:hypothetical protein